MPLSRHWLDRDAIDDSCMTDDVGVMNKTAWCAEQSCYCSVLVSLLGVLNKPSRKTDCVESVYFRTF